jgi:hypothetical protein
MKKIICSIIATFVLAVTLWAQSGTTETSTSMTVSSFSPAQATADFPDGTFIIFRCQPNVSWNGEIEVPGETQVTFFNFTCTPPPSGATYLTYTVNTPVTVQTQNHTVTIQFANYTSVAYTRSGRGGGTSYRTVGGSSEITIQ